MTIGIRSKLPILWGIVFSIALTQCAWWWHRAPQANPDLILETLNLTPTELVTYTHGIPIRQVWNDDRGRPERVIYFDLSGHKTRIDHYMQPNLELTRQQIFSLPDSQIIWTVQTVTENQQVQTRDWTDAREQSLGKESCTYNASGMLTEKLLLGGSGKILRRQMTDPNDSEETQTIGYDDQERWQTFTSGKKGSRFYWYYNLTATGKIRKTELRTHDDLVIWRAVATHLKPNRELLKIYSGTGQFILQTERENAGGIFLTQDSIPTITGGIWQDRSIFNMDRQALTDSTTLQTWQTVATNMIVRKQQIHNRTELPIEDIFYNANAPQQLLAWYQYDYMGNLAQITNYSTDGSIGWVQLLERTPAGQMVKSTLNNGQGDRHETTWYHYTPEGILNLMEHQGPFGNATGSEQIFSDGPFQLIRERNGKSEIVKDLTMRLTGDTLRWATYKNLGVIWLGMYYDAKGQLTAQKRLTPDEFFGQTIYFDPDGRRIKEEFLRKDGSVFQRKRYFSRQSKIRVRESFSPEGALTGVDSVYLNAAGQISRLISRDEFGKITIAEKTYYENGKASNSQRLDGRGTILTQTSFQYDSLGNAQTTEVSDSTGQIISRTHFAYDNTGQNISEQIQNAAGVIVEEHRFQYDTQGRLFREQVLQDGQLVETIEYEYLPDYKLRVANHFAPGGELGRSEIEDFPPVAF